MRSVYSSKALPKLVGKFENATVEDYKKFIQSKGVALPADLVAMEMKQKNFQKCYHHRGVAT